MAKSYRDTLKEALPLRRSQAEYKVLLAFLKKHKITNTLKLKHMLKLREQELRDYLRMAEKSPTMNQIRRRKTKELDWISFVKKKYIPFL